MKENMGNKQSSMHSLALGNKVKALKSSTEGKIDVWSYHLYFKYIFNAFFVNSTYITVLLIVLLDCFIYSIYYILSTNYTFH